MDNMAKVFIASSKEGLPVAEAIREQLFGDELQIEIWKDPGMFELSETAIESLESQKERFDFALFMLTPDDVVKFRSNEISAPRDNLILELGLFMGSIGRRRTFIIKPEEEALKLPSDLNGVTVAGYRAYDSPEGCRYDVGAACNKIRRAIRKAPPLPIEEILSRAFFPPHLLRYCLWVFEEYLKQKDYKPVFDCDAQLTVTGRQGKIIEHPHFSSIGHNARVHKGQIIWASIDFEERDRPFKAIYDATDERGWITWMDKGYSQVYTPISDRSNYRICVVHFRLVDEIIYILEIHHELGGPLHESLLSRLADTIKHRIREAERDNPVPPTFSS